MEACLACCAACFVGIIESMVEYFNRYNLLLELVDETHSGILDMPTLKLVSDTSCKPSRRP